MTFLPLLGAAVILCVPKGKDDVVRWIAAAASFLPVLLAVKLWFDYDRTVAGVNVANQFQFVEQYSWIPSINVEYFMGADGISMPMLLLTALLSFLAVIGSFGIEKKVKGYMALFLLLETGMMGVFVALDFFLFYVFWEVMLLPMYFLIGIWGGPRKEYAAIKFFLYTLLGSILMLIVLLALYFNTTNPETGGHTFNLLHYMAQNTHNAWLKGFDVRILMFLGLFIGFAIKVPLFPFHTWLPDAHVEAPTAGSVILAGILLKMGTYGLLRFAFPLFPDAAVYFAPYLAGLAVIGIVYGALVAMVQPDLKKLVAYSSVSHLGFVVLGIAAMNVQGIEGAVYQMLNHGVSTGALFLIVGMLSDRRHTRLIAEFGGLKGVMPRLTAVFLIITLSSVGLPGLNGFVGEFLILLGAFRWHRGFAAVAALGVILSAVYMLWMFQRVNYGEVTNDANRSLPDLTVRERWVIVPTVAAAVLMGVMPSIFLRPMEPAVRKLLGTVNHGTVVVTARPPEPAPAAAAPRARYEAPRASVD